MGTHDHQRLLLTNCVSGSIAKQPWYALHVRSNFERAVSLTLQEKGYEFFLPTYRVERNWSDRVKCIDVPLFPGYVFCRLDISARLPVLTTPGTLRIVGYGNTPAPLADSEIEAVCAVVKSNLPYQPWPSLAPGQRVLVERGPLAGVEGVMIEARRQLRLLISVELLHRSVAVEIDSTWVRPISNFQSQLAPQSKKVNDRISRS